MQKRRMAAEEGQVIGVHTVDAWKDQIQKGNESGKLVSVYYYPPTFSFISFCYVLILAN